MTVPNGSVGAPDSELSDSPGALSLHVLGPLRIWRDGAEVDAGPQQQGHVLAVLLARVGHPTSTAELIDAIWGRDPPTSAVNVLHKYIGALRRVLEPALPARGAGSYLSRRGDGYLFTVHPNELDLLRFRNNVGDARTAMADDRLDAALDHYARALELWNGPAGDGFAHGPTASAIFAGLNDEFFDACAAAVDLAVATRHPERVLASVRLAAAMAPLHERVQAGLITVLGAAGRQVEALSVYQAVRGRLAEDLGLDPGEALEKAHQDVLQHNVVESRRSHDPDRADVAILYASPLVGRAEEIKMLEQVVDGALAGRAGSVIVEGEPGVGKTRVLQEIATDSVRRDVLVVWGRSLEREGMPSMWPWVQVVRALIDVLPVAARDEWVNSEIGRLVEPRDGVLSGPLFPDSGTQFRLFEGVVAFLENVSAARPSVIVLDDLQWADSASLQLFAHLAGRLPAGIAIIGAMRDRAPTPTQELARMLAATGRVPGHRRIRLASLNVAEVAELVRFETGQDPPADLARGLHARTGGNPFFVRELSRYLADDDALTADSAAAAKVPASLRDVVKDRLTHLDEVCTGLLHVAALIGRTVTLDLLAEAAGLTVQTCLDKLDSLEAFGFLEQTPRDPFSYSFTHDLIRDSVVGIIPNGQAPHLHLRIGDALERAGADDDSVAERLAYHLWSAGPLAESARTARALMNAGSSAATKSALEAAEEHLRSAVLLSRKAGLAELELSALSQLTAVVGMRSMYGMAALELFERAEHLARGLGRKPEAAGFLFSRWTALQQAIELDRSGPVARRLLEQGYESSDPLVRTYGLQAWGIHQWDVGNVGEAVRYLSQTKQTLVDGLASSDEDPVAGDLQSLMVGMLAEVTALHGEVDAARELLGVLEGLSGENPYRTTVWATMACRVAAIVGDTAWALRAAQLGIAVDPGFSFVFLGTYQRLARCWAITLSSDDPDTWTAAIEEAQQLIAANLLDPPRSCVATWYALLGEMLLASRSVEAADEALDRAQFYVDAFGQRYPQGLILLLRARGSHARGETLAAVQSAAEAARAWSVDHEAGLFVQRVDRFLAELR
ncbi:BTAD domain-containing putative transcriptional regulator [Mycolicibacterium moriokaense]|uniref:BTAD domain-containing putative transcriptional regulator n=1 Tax=Mycolicibacterium moriokaense TaxID=39691 RepID=UPI001F3D29FC|nr:BTAD domain-containing putative transcriptional regulator [Mycolicibacterium moriokaense]